MPTFSRLITRDDDHPAIIEPRTGLVVSYQRLHEEVARAAAALRHLGAGQGTRVGLYMANGPALVVAFLAIARCGAVAVPLNPSLGERELASELSDLGASLLLHGPEVAEAAASLCRPGGRLAGLPFHVATFSAAGLSLGGRAAASKPTSDVPPADEDLVVLLLHTSGTTNRPKTVPLRQRNLAASTGAVVASYNLGPDDVTLCVMPLFHVHGLVASMLATLASGGTLVVPPRFSATTFWDDVDRFGATWYSAVPTIHTTVVAKALEAASRPAHSLRFVRSCSAPLPVVHWQRFEDVVGVPLVEAYGMTEASHQMATNPLPPGERRPGTVGRQSGTEVRVLDDDGVVLAPGTVGSVAVRGPSVVDGYLDNDEANAASFRDGFLLTGDVGSLSADGYLTLAGRTKELINRGGEKISPYEIEAVLLAHGSVRDAAAFAVPDERYGEQVAAAVVASSTVSEEQLRQHCAAQLAAFKVPVMIVQCDELPKGPTGKVQRRLLADLLAR
jgi:acyl-CoA synthetase (AMP-forming)/AMP-acid ligase II